MKKIKDLKKGDLFKLKETSKMVLVRLEYNRFSKKYDCANYHDCLQDFRAYPGDKMVLTDSEFDFDI